MNVEIITPHDLLQFKNEILDEIKKLHHGKAVSDKKWLKTREVCKLLKCSPGTLQNLRIQGIIEYTKFGGTLYYSADSINKVLENNKRNGA